MNVENCCSSAVVKVILVHRWRQFISLNVQVCVFYFIQGSPDELCMLYSHIKPVDGIYHDRHRISAAVYMQDQRSTRTKYHMCENMCNSDVFACLCIFRYLSYAFSYTYQLNYFRAKPKKCNYDIYNKYCCNTLALRL